MKRSCSFCFFPEGLWGRVIFLIYSTFYEGVNFNDVKPHVSNTLHASFHNSKFYIEVERAFILLKFKLGFWRKNFFFFSRLKKAELVL